MLCALQHHHMSEAHSHMWPSGQPLLKQPSVAQTSECLRLRIESIYDADRIIYSILVHTARALQRRLGNEGETLDHSSL